MAWRLARSLEVLRDEANQAAPGRSKVSDGTIGDAAHSSRTSDHNPDSYGVVAALDLTHDPGAGADMHVWSDELRVGGHPALKYIIWNRRITSRAVDEFHSWRPYNGSNPHTAHMHVSVERPYYDNTTPWGLEDNMTDEDRRRLNHIYTLLNWAFVTPKTASGHPDITKPAFAFTGELSSQIGRAHV